MKKSYFGMYPPLREKQFETHTQALLCMVNCRRYLYSHDFKEVIDMKDYYNSVNGISGTIVFPDGSKLDHAAFIQCQSRDGILEKIVDGSRFERPPVSLNDTYERDRVVRTTMKNKGYTVTLSVVDTTKLQSFFPVSVFLTSPKKFAFTYHMLLDLGIITDADVEEFETYKAGLDETVKHRDFLTFTAQTRKVSEQPKDSSEKPAATSFIDPWDADILRLGGKKK
ncbi:MAG: hypothetical protein ABIH63_00565 [archaeon]